MITVAAYIASRAAQYVGDTRLTAFEAQAEAEISNNAFGDLRSKAIFLLMMHWLTLDDRGGAIGSGTGSSIGGTVKREKEGGLEREYMLDFSLTLKYPDLSQTRWGLELIGLRKSKIFGPRTRFTTAE